MADPSKDFQLALADRYQIESELGHGTMATVYLARDLRHQRHVALKVLRPDSGIAMSDVRFVREIKYLAQLHHPNILPLHDSGLAAGQLYYVMPHVRGESLRARLDREGPLPIKDAVHIGCEVAGALDYAHRRSVIHRDIKPENILLHGSHTVIADFGIARAIGAAAGEQLTTVRSVGPGTPAYMSPEQLLPGQELDGRSDLYSLATVLYESLTGQLPFATAEGRTDNARKMRGKVPRLSALRPDVPPQIEYSITRALALSPEDRFSSALEFAKVIAEWDAARIDAASSATSPARSTASEFLRARPWIWAAAVAAAFILGAVVAAAVFAAL